MLKSYFKTVLRSLWINKGFSFLNILGLSIGITCAALIFLWVENEVNYDQFNLKKNRIYNVKVNTTLDDRIFTHSSTPGVLGPAIQKEIPGIENTCRTTEGLQSLLFQIGDKSMYASGIFAEGSLFNLFTLPFLEGNPITALKDVKSIIITEKTAKKFFGQSNNVVGKIIRISNKEDYTVSGVIKDLPENSSLKFEWILPFEIYYNKSPWAHFWSNNTLSTYVELKDKANLILVNKQLYNFIKIRVPNTNTHLFLFGMNDWHLRNSFENGKRTGGQILYVKLFSSIAWVLIFIACINFMNLATAQSEKRAKEVGVRKVMGAGKKDLLFLFMGESLLMAFISGLLALILIAITLPEFNLLVNKNMSLSLNKPFHIFVLALIIVICGIVAGSYPSIYLSSFNPIYVFRGLKLKDGSAPLIRKSLVIVQFTVSLILIINTILIYQQIQHVKSRNLGFNKNNLIEIPLQGDLIKHYNSLKQDLIQTGEVENTALSDHTTLYAGNNTTGLTWEGKPANAKILISERYVSPEFIQTSGMKIIEGRDFHIADTMVARKNLNILITESLAKLLGGKSLIGKILRNQGSSGNGDTSNISLTVIGIVKDYIYGNMYGKPDPVVFLCVSPEHTSLLYARIKDNSNIENSISAITSVFKKDNPAYPFEFHFVDEQFNDQFQSETLISKITWLFATLTILISCLGLFGLAAFTCERRTKEIGIRKVLGSNLSRITMLISMEFLILIGFSILIAIPVAWYTINNWLKNYEYRIEINAWVFFNSSLLVVFIALTTIGFQTIKAGLTNPIKSLRT